jgi:Domain of unknown function (DUF4386)
MALAMTLGNSVRFMLPLVFHYKSSFMKSTKLIGTLLIAGAIGVFIPYTILTITFQYPDILRQEPGVVLTIFHEGGSSLIFTWWAFAMLGMPLLIAYILIGKQWKKLSFMSWVTTVGVISGIAQIIGLLRWVFIIPVIAQDYVLGNEVVKQSAITSFKIVHQLGGVLLGEHIGQLFTIVWTVMVCVAIVKLKLMPTWVSLFGIVASAIYLLAQAELFATVIPGFPVWDLAGFIGSTLWLVWLIIIGVYFVRIQKV